MRLNIFIIIIICIFCSDSLTAQKNNKKITITGTVLDVSSNPIVNAIVLIDGKNTSSVTNSRGEYKVRVKHTASRIGIFTFGNGIIEDSINGRIRIDFNLRTISVKTKDLEVSPGEEGVDLGYSRLKKKRLSNNVSSFDFQNSKRTYRDIYEMLNEIPGIGSRVYNMNGPVGPTYVVNGIVVTSIDNILPSTVESIVFLKDASAAIYGSRAFGGVILIKTKIPIN